MGISQGGSGAKTLSADLTGSQMPFIPVGSLRSPRTLHTDLSQHCARCTEAGSAPRRDIPGSGESAIPTAGDTVPAATKIPHITLDHGARGGSGPIAGGIHTISLEPETQACRSFQGRPATGSDTPRPRPHRSRNLLPPAARRPAAGTICQRLPQPKCCHYPQLRGGLYKTPSAGTNRAHCLQQAARRMPFCPFATQR